MKPLFSETVFRSPDLWKSALLTLPDSTYFELMRSVFGNIKTPFNKQRLIEDLASFLSRKDIQETIAAYIDETDAKIITAVVALEEPAPGELESFFTGEYSYSDLQKILLNLEERLIIYRFREDRVFRLALNPRLESILAPIAADPSILFPAAPLASAPPSPLDDRMLTAFLCFLLSGETVFRSDDENENALRKKTADDAAALFPGIDAELLCASLFSLGLLFREGDSLGAGMESLAAFSALPFGLRFSYIAAGIALEITRRESGGFQSISLLRKTASLVSALYASIASPPGVFPGPSLNKRAEILRRDMEGGWGFDETLPDAKTIIAAMSGAGLLVDAGQGFAAAQDGECPSRQPAIAMDSPFSFILYPGVPFSRTCDIALFCAVEETGEVLRFSISRESVVRGFDRGLDSGRMWNLLQSLSGDRAGESLRFNLCDWENRYRELALYSGVVLRLGEDRRYLAETAEIAAMIRSSLAPGVYLLSAENAAAAAAVLKRAGVDIIACPRSEKKQVSVLFQGGIFAPGTAALPHTDSLSRYSGKQEAAAGSEALCEELKESFREKLARMKLNDHERDELESRIERRMMLCDAQLDGASLRYEKLEARSLDYVGKAAVARQAIASGSLLELVWPSPRGGEFHVFGRGEALEKKGGEMILVVQTREGGEDVSPGETCIRVPLGKISLVRRIKQSIFGE